MKEYYCVTIGILPNIQTLNMHVEFENSDESTF